MVIVVLGVSVPIHPQSLSRRCPRKMMDTLPFSTSISRLPSWTSQLVVLELWITLPCIGLGAFPRSSPFILFWSITVGSIGTKRSRSISRSLKTPLIYLVVLRLRASIGVISRSVTLPRSYRVLPGTVSYLCLRDRSDNKTNTLWRFLWRCSHAWYPLDRSRTSSTTIRRYPQLWRQFYHASMWSRRYVILMHVSQDSYWLFFFLEYFHGLLQRAPVILPQTTPIYSNTAFRILGYILEVISNTPFDKLLDSSVLQPLNLTTTSYGIPAEGSWVIPNGDSAWYQNTGDETP